MFLYKNEIAEIDSDNELFSDIDEAQPQQNQQTEAPKVRFSNYYDFGS
jgi:hypothetical protein